MPHQNIIFICCIIGLILYVLWRIFLKRKQYYFSRAVITRFETRMFLRLNQAFPQHYILTQVAFSALITSKDYKIRNQFNRKVTDFVILDQKMLVIAIVELDDPTHLNKHAEDMFRDHMLTQAGYKVFRYTSIPSTSKLRKDIL